MSAADKGKRFYTTEQLGPRQAETPEGFLICHDVPIARVGSQEYGPDEVPIEPGPSGTIMVERKPEEVFRTETMLSASGKPVTDDHPDDDVTPLTWRKLAVGHVQNIRRGEGEQRDLLIADLLVMDKDAIVLVREGKREVSCGYDANYFEIEPGRGEQRDILINHVALVEKGRCGPRCAIGDHASGESDMKFRDKAKSTVMDRLRIALKGRDEKAIADALDEAEKEVEKANDNEAGTALHVHLPEGSAGGTKDDPMEARFKTLETGMAGIMDRLDKMGGKGKDAEAEAEKEKEKKEAEDRARDAEGETEKELEEEAPAGKGDKARKAKDSVYLEDSFQATVAAAEILVPGIRVPAFDRAIDPKKSLDGICKFRRQALDLAYSQPDGRGIIDDVLGGKTYDGAKMTCGAVRSLFNSATAVKKAQNKSGTKSTVTDGLVPGGGLGVRGAIKSPTDLAKHAAEYYAGKKA